MKALLYFLILFGAVIGIEGRAQGQGSLKTEYITSSSYKNKDGENFGSGSFFKVSGRYHLPLSVKTNDSGQLILWSASLSSSYGILENRNAAKSFNPDKILNTGIHIAHVRPVSPKWSLVATLGGGIYGSPDDISAKSILISGGAIFMYKIRNNLDVGIGLGLTNSFGLPIVMPMTVINWHLSGKYEVKADIASGMEISGAMNLNEQLKLRLVAMEMDGMSAVMEVDKESMIYASTTIKSYLSAEYQMGKGSVIYIGAGGAWERSTTLTKRSLKEFFKNLFDDENRHLGFSTAGYFTVGIRYGL